MDRQGHLCGIFLNGNNLKLYISCDDPKSYKQYIQRTLLNPIKAGQSIAPKKQKKIDNYVLDTLINV